jgi:D-glucosaminate-6-phosphate ammonia-lyase
MNRVINGAGKLTALGGSAQSERVADAQRQAATENVDLAELRREAGERIARLCGADAACITSGAAAGISIAIAALITGENLEKISQLPQTEGEQLIVLQAGHHVNFGAPVEQMIRLGGGDPLIIGETNLVTEQRLTDALLSYECRAMLYVQSHHCVQSNQIPLARCIQICGEHDIPLVVDAAAEEDLRKYIDAGADLVIYSGGKAFSGPTCGFIVGQERLISACELQFLGIARTMKVGKEAIAGLLAALQEYTTIDESDRLALFDVRVQKLQAAIGTLRHFKTEIRADEAGRPFTRVAIIELAADSVRALVQHLHDGDPSIRTRNHHLDEGYVLIDPREIRDQDVRLIASRIVDFDRHH